MKKLEDYIHLYIGCPVSILCDMPDGNYTISGAITKAINEQDICRVQCYNEQRRQIYWLDIDMVTLILRPLESMTGEEIKQWVAQPDLTDHYCAKKLREISVSVYGLYNFISFYGSHDSINWLLQKGFDLFGLIPAGLAQKRED